MRGRDASGDLAHPPRMIAFRSLRRPTRSLRRRLRAWPIAVACALGLGAPASGAPSAANAPGAAAPTLELRRGDRSIPAGGHDVAGATKPDGPREQDFSYTVTNRGDRPVRLLPLIVERAINCRVTSTVEPAVDSLAPGAALNLTVHILPRDRGPWRAALALAGRPEDGAAPAFAWSIAAPGP